MVSLTEKEREYINMFYTKRGDIKIEKIDRKERICIVSVPVYDGQEDYKSQEKTITIPVDYFYDGEDVVLYNIPIMFDESDINNITEYVWDIYNE